jgi:hypothetical protein
MSKSGYIYIIQQRRSTYYKIGYTTKDVHKRVAELQTGNPEELHIISYHHVDDRRKTERILHDIAGKYHYRGEWFLIPDQDVIKELQRYIDRKV